MGRPSMAEERREQALRAFATCVARAGFAGTSLEDVAAEAGLARGHVRHYLGNRHDQVVALCEWISRADQAEFAEARQAPDGQERVDAVMGYLFDPPFYQPGEDLDVFLALFEEARRDDDLRKVFVDGYRDILDTTAGALHTARPDLPSGDPEKIAYLMLCAAIGNAHLAQMGFDTTRARGLGALCRRALRLLLGRA